MNTISITGLRLRAHHGVLPQERQVGNDFRVDITLTVPAASSAMETDELGSTVNYARVVDIVKEEMAEPAQLLEYVVGRIERHIRSEFGSMVSGGSITLSKLAPPIAAQIDAVSFTHTW